MVADDPEKRLPVLLAGDRLDLDRFKVALGVEQLVFVDILARLGGAIDNLGMSFDAELDRVRNSFDSMLNAIPLGSSASVSVSVSV